MAFVLRRMFVAPLLIINFTLYFIIAAVAGWALDTAIDQGWEAVSYNPATYYFVLFSLLAGVLGLGSKFSAAHHLTTWHHHSLASSSSVSYVSWLVTVLSYVSWLVTVLAMGLALKQISLGGFLRGEVVFLEALVIIVAITHLSYLLGLGVCVYRGEYAGGNYPIQGRDAAMESTTPTPPAKE
ncbi:hypothetical protein KP509_37G005100 [Ceratopteris richardii]|uniref:Uncharacterized protein n=1 Tax=Ceratopteris richardii TaxID=49495 RepID=A0A8T2Q733_CERRI|nr:hypothetical protein KP509_37G005100 [Ceratopteris richardii]